MKILVTGTAGFIGFHLVSRLISEGNQIVGLDSVNDYYDPQLKFDRLEVHGVPKEKVLPGREVISSQFPSYKFVRLNLEDRKAIMDLFEKETFDSVCHLAAQAGVRYSLTNPYAYIESNITGFINILEACRHYGVRHLVYASSSSVYGLNETMPFSTSHNVDHPISLYAASKKSNELMAHTYSYLYGLPTTGLRFFTVYGPWGRPDMALFLFTKAILEGSAIDVYNHGRMKRDFTYIDDIIEGILRVIQNPPQGQGDWSGKNPDPSASSSPYRIYNIGNSQPVELMDFIRAIEKGLGKTARKNMLPIQPGDVPATWADVTDLFREMDYRPKTSYEQGVEQFIAWYKSYYQLNA
jgi:UDP-glucuronate 4-epimerase